jgi:hypothetical protein
LTWKASISRSRQPRTRAVNFEDPADDCDAVRGGCRDLVEHGSSVAEKAFFQEQIFGGIATKGEFRETDQVTALRFAFSKE